MKKRGFSIAEMTTVLLIIGIIVAFGIKVKSVMESAKVRERIGRITKIQNGLYGYAIYVNSHDIVSALEYSSNKYKTDELIEYGFVTDKDLKIYDFGGNPYSEWKLVSCLLGPEGTNNHDIYSSNKYLNICLVADGNNDRFAEYSFICYIEKHLDDQRFDKGNARAASGGAIPDQCQSLTGKRDMSFLLY